MSSPYDDLGAVQSAPVSEEKPVAKRITRSKTFWVNLFAGIGSIITVITNSELLAEKPEVAAYGATALAVINLVLRFVTKDPVKLG
jgi:hypothetical protein